MSPLPFPDFRALVSDDDDGSVPGLDRDLTAGNCLHNADDGNDGIIGRGALSGTTVS